MMPRASLWGLACDIAVEQTIDALQVPSLTRPVGWLRQKTYQALRKNGAMPAAGPIYRWLAAQEPDELQKLHREFVCDSHRLWPKDPTSLQAQVQGRRWEQLGRETRISMQQAGQQAVNKPVQPARRENHWKREHGGRTGVPGLRN